MQDLEDRYADYIVLDLSIDQFRLAQYEQLWSLRFPDGPSDIASSSESHPVEDLLRFSSGDQMAGRTLEITPSRKPDLPDTAIVTDTNSMQTGEPIRTGSQSNWNPEQWVLRDHTVSLTTDVPVVPAANEPTYPPTRPASPQDLSLREVYEPHTSSHTPEQEWREPDSTENEAPTWNSGMLDGMGATQLTLESKKAGAGYIGLSSSATLLLAIRRLVAKRSASSVTDDWIGTVTFETWADQPSTASSEDITPTPFPRFPPSRETQPLIDSYFTHFRE